MYSRNRTLFTCRSDPHSRFEADLQKFMKKHDFSACEDKNGELVFSRIEEFNIDYYAKMSLIRLEWEQLQDKYDYFKYVPQVVS